LNLRGKIWFLLAVVVVALCYTYAYYTPEFDSNGNTRTILACIIGIAGLGMVFTFPKFCTVRSIVWIMTVATAARLAVFPTAPSDDVNRYLWEGKLYAQGISPYENVGSHESYLQHRDHYYDGMNHKDTPTAYPPFALHCFSLINKIGYSPTSYKIVFLLLDVMLIAVILALLSHYQRPLQWALIYALSPLSILSFAAEGHFDIVMVLFLMLSILAMAKKWIIPCGIAVGLAISVKIMAAVVAPIILLKTGMKGILAGFITCLIPVAIHYQDSLDMMLGLINFGSNFRFNGPANDFIVHAFGTSHDFAGSLCTLLFFVSWGIGFGLCVKNKFWSSINFCLGSLIFFSPIVHFWYLTWLLPFIALRPSLPWITMSVSMPLYFTVWSQLESNGYWGMPIWARILFWLPFIIACLMHLPRHTISLYHSLTAPISHRSADAPRWSIVIPTLNIDDRLKNLILALEKQDTLPQEVVIVCSSNSEEKNSILSDNFDIKVIQSPVGRGIQIKAGIEATEKDWCLVLHGDNKLQLDTFTKLNAAILANPDIVGGSLGQRFDRSAPGLLLIEAMNDFRASLLQTSFGDQNQFFHTETAHRKGILTDQPLMEDIEMSDRLRLHGDTLHLAHESSVSAEKWKKKTYWSRFFTIVGFYAKYRALFYSAEKRANLSKRFYKKYYPKQAEK